jgi:hypothetical protein
MAGMNWRKSSYSGGASGNCTEVAAVPGAVLVRDSQDPRGPVLAFRRKTWQAFAAVVKADACHARIVAGCWRG